MKFPKTLEGILVPLWLLLTLKWGRLHFWILRHWRRNSIFVQEWEMGMWSLLPEKVLASVLSRFKPKSVLDVGCGTGKALDYFLSQGLDASGVEGSRLAISHSPHREKIRRHNLEHPLDLGRRFDLVWSFEVAEHLRPEKAPVLVDTMVRHTDLVILSAAPPGQDGDGHFNEQPPEYWIGLFAARGFELLSESTAELRAQPENHARNLLVFAKKKTDV